MMSLPDCLLSMQMDLEEALCFYNEGEYSIMRANIQHLRDTAIKALSLSVPELNESAEPSDTD